MKKNKIKLPLALALLLVSPFLSAQAEVLTSVSDGLHIVQWAKEAQRWAEEMQQYAQQLQLMKQMVTTMPSASWNNSINSVSNQLEDFNRLHNTFKQLATIDDREYVQSLIMAGNIDALEAQTALYRSLEESAAALEGAKSGVDTTQSALASIKKNAQTAKDLEPENNGLLKAIQQLNMSMADLAVITADVAATSAKSAEYARLQAQNEAAQEELARELRRRQAAPPPERAHFNQKELEDLIFGRAEQKKLW